MKPLLGTTSFLAVTGLALLASWWLIGDQLKPALEQEIDVSTVIQNCTDYPVGPDRSYCERDLSAVQMRLPCDTLTNPEFRLECDWREAIIARTPEKCDNLSADRRDLCLWDVVVARHAYAGRPTRSDWSLCDQIKKEAIRELCRTRSYAMGS